jgi:hypothetical protein
MIINDNDRLEFLEIYMEKLDPVLKNSFLSKPA